MTAEQEKQIAEIRAVDYHETSGIGKLLAIIDDLQNQKPKRYTEAELYGIWRDAPESETGDSEESWDGALWFARFLGMIKTEGES